jgi:hypothetical protein
VGRLELLVVDASAATLVMPATAGSVTACVRRILPTLIDVGALKRATDRSEPASRTAHAVLYYQ